MVEMFSPVLSDAELREFEGVSVFAIIVPPQSMKNTLNVLQKLYPIPELHHARRVRKIQTDTDVQLSVLIGLCDHLNEHDVRQSLSSSLNLDSLDLKTVIVSKYPALTRSQFDSFRKPWPIHFRESPTRIFRLSEQDTQTSLNWFKKVVELEERENSPVALMVDPATNMMVGTGISRRLQHPLHHATMLCIEDVAKRELENRGKEGDERKRKADDESDRGYLCKDFDFYVLSEPCIMCSMALLHSRIGRVFYKESDLEKGGLGGRFRLHTHERLNHHFQVFQFNMKE